MSESNKMLLMAIIGMIAIYLITYLWRQWLKKKKMFLSYLRPEIYNQLTEEDIENQKKKKEKKDFSKNEERLKQLEANDINYKPRRQILREEILKQKEEDQRKLQEEADRLF
jgi:hypothetical protein